MSDTVLGSRHCTLCKNVPSCCLHGACLKQSCKQSKTTILTSSEMKKCTFFLRDVESGSVAIYSCAICALHKIA